MPAGSVSLAWKPPVLSEGPLFVTVSRKFTGPPGDALVTSTSFSSVSAGGGGVDTTVTVAVLLGTGFCTSALWMVALLLISVPFPTLGLTRTWSVTLPLWLAWRLPRFQTMVLPNGEPPLEALTNEVFCGSGSWIVTPVAAPAPRPLEKLIW